MACLKCHFLVKLSFFNWPEWPSFIHGKKRAEKETEYWQMNNDKDNDNNNKIP